MPHHIQRVYTFRITADEINQIMGCRPNHLTDSEIEFMNDAITKQTDSLRNNIMCAITKAKEELKEHRARHERIQSALKQERDRHFTRLSWLNDNPGKKLVYWCNTCEKYGKCLETPEQHLAEFGHEATQFQMMEDIQKEIYPITDADIVSAD
jgi:NAD-dependent dihydropyrimidine dehydrogenase PreA subunit